MECEHYKHNCVFICPNMKCKKPFPCYQCHDEWVTDHQMDRYIVNRLVCNNCFKEQNVSRRCTSCGTIFGRYFCDICILFDDRDLNYFHCFDCGFCRTGGRNNHKHCQKCNTCVPLSLLRSHSCVENSTSTTCPICIEDISPTYHESVTMPCGHSVHRGCFEKLFQTPDQNSCPVCRKVI